MTPRVLYAAAAIVVAATAIVLAYSDSVVLDAIALVASGAAWISGIGLLAAAYQTQMPPWVKARGMSYYLVAFQGSNAVGGLAFGAVAQASSVSDAFLAISACLLVGSLLTWRLALPQAISAEVEAAEPWALPEVQDPEAGPVMVTVTWPVQPERLDDFLALAGELRRLRRRTGAGSWRLYRQAEDRYELLETFIVGSWAEHERQHARMYPAETAVIDRLVQTLLPGRPRLVNHSLAVSTRETSRSARSSPARTAGRRADH
jgi:hypothetical protein